MKKMNKNQCIIPTLRLNDMNTFAKIVLLTFCIGSLSTLFSCQEDPAIVLNSEADILDIVLEGQSAPAIIDCSSDTVYIVVDEGTDLRNLQVINIVVSEGASFPEIILTELDFSEPVPVPITAPDGTVNTWYIVVAEALSDETDILTFAISQGGPSGSNPTIDSDNHTVALEVVAGTDLSDVSPIFTLSAGATSDPTSGTPGDYSNPVTIMVTAQNGSTTQPWTVNVSIAEDNETDILTFTAAEQTGPAVIDYVNHTVTLEVAEFTDLNDILPTWTLSTGAQSSPPSGFLGGWTSNNTILVTSSDNTEDQEWRVAIYAAGSSETDILHFILPEQIGHADIDRTKNEIDIEVERGTGLTNLTPTIVLPDGATSVPSSGTTGDYTPVVTITVTAQDGATTEEWHVFVTEEGIPHRSTANDILSFSFDEQAGLATIDPGVGGGSISIYVLNGTDLSNLTPTFTLSPGATAEPASDVPHDFSETPYFITVFAEDIRYTQEWQVHIIEATDPNNQADIFTFSFPEQTGDAEIRASSQKVIIEVENGTDLTNLTPTFTLSPGATAVPASLTPGDYSTIFFIEVTAEDGEEANKKTWAVDVTVAN